MKQTLIITDLTRMQGDRVCVAGYTADGVCVRPVFKKSVLTEAWLRSGGKMAIRPFAVIDFDIHSASPLSVPPHTEDRIIDTYYHIHGPMKTPEEQFDWLRAADDTSVGCIFGAPIHSDNGPYIRAGEGTRSLGTVRVKRLDEVQFAPISNGKWLYRLIFVDATGQHYNLPVTDLAFRTYLDYLRDQRHISLEDIARRITTIFRQNPLFLRIGLARGWDRYPDRCYIQITGVYSFPDYLSGRCFADFAPPSSMHDGFFAKLVLRHGDFDESRVLA